MLEFEHIIQVNDPEQPTLRPLSRQELWEGLLFRARQPGRFTDSLECRIEEVEEGAFIRRLRAGGSEFRDKVFLFPPNEIHSQTTGEPEQLYAESISRIEEPAPGYLFVRFTYRRDSGNVEGVVDVDEHLKSAYVHNDRDALAMIRQFAEHGLLEKPG